MKKTAVIIGLILAVTIISGCKSEAPKTNVVKTEKESGSVTKQKEEKTSTEEKPNDSKNDVSKNTPSTKVDNEKPKTEAAKEEPKQAKEVQLNKEEWKKLNTFFSNFSEVRFPAFKKGNIPNDELIRFGVYHNNINNSKLFVSAGENKVKISEKYVVQSVEKYFGKASIKHTSIDGIEYSNGYYIIPLASGEGISFSQVSKLFDNGDSTFTAYINVYEASSGFVGDFHGNMDSWKKEDENPPELGSKMKATITKVTVDGKSRYILLDYFDEK